MAEFQNTQNLYVDVPSRRARQDPSFLELARELASYGGVVVGIMDDPRFAGQETPRALRYRHFVETWGSLPDVRVLSLDADQIRSHSLLFKGSLDVLVFPYGGVYPMEAYRLYSGQSFDYFLKRGGAVLTTGGIPFRHQASPDGKAIETDTSDKLTDVFDKWISRFGIKYYQCRVPPSMELPDCEMLPELPRTACWQPSSTGVVVVNSAHEPVPKPSAGNVFPERTPARTVIPLLRGCDRWHQDLVVSAVLAQDFENGSRRIHFTHEHSDHPLSPDAPTSLIGNKFIKETLCFCLPP